MPLIAGLLAATVRHRRPALVAGLVLATGHVTALWWWPRLAGRLFTGSVALVAVLVILMIIGWSQAKPSTLTVRPERHAFEAPAGPAPVYAALCCLAVAAGQLASTLRDLRADRLAPFNLVWTALWLLVAARWVFLAWSGLGARLTPAGVRNRDVFGSVAAPWAAFDSYLSAVAAPRQPNVLVTYARPELVRLRGVVLSRRLLRADTVDALFLAGVLQHYVHHPEHRQAIGAHAEYARLLRALR